VKRGNVPIGEIKDIYGCNALSAAAMGGELELVRSLISDHVRRMRARVRTGKTNNSVKCCRG
jgi:hypothetical protein